MEPLCNLVGRRISVNWNDFIYEGRITSIYMVLYPSEEVCVVAKFHLTDKDVLMYFPTIHPRQDGLSYTLIEDEDV